MSTTIKVAESFNMKVVWEIGLHWRRRH